MRPQGLAEEEFYNRILGEVSRTFALSIRALPGGLREAVRTAYLLCRIVDTVEDGPGAAPALRQDLFASFDRALASALRGDPRDAFAFERLAAGTSLGEGAERELLLASGSVFEAFARLSEPERRAIAPRIQEMSTGMREYAARAAAASGLRIADLPDLERYCHFVAGTVGELLTDLFALDCPVDPRRKSLLDARAGRFGLGLQLVNVLKDVAEDAARGDCFLPVSLASEHGVPLERLLEPSARFAALKLCREVSARAREHLRAAEEYVLLLPAEHGAAARIFCAGPLALALGTLRLVELGTDALVPGISPSVSRDFVMGVFMELARTGAEGPSNAALVALFERARHGVSDRPSRPPEPPMPRRPDWGTRDRAQSSLLRAGALAS